MYLIHTYTHVNLTYTPRVCRKCCWLTLHVHVMSHELVRTNELEVTLLEGEDCQQSLKSQTYRAIIWRLAHMTPLRKLEKFLNKLGHTPMKIPPPPLSLLLHGVTRTQQAAWTLDYNVDKAMVLNTDQYLASGFPEHRVLAFQLSASV